MKIIKKPFTLIEMIIALSLTVMILTALTFFYRQMGEIDIETERVIANNFKLRYVETRLASILPRAVGETDQKNDFVFFSVGDEGVTKSGSQSLIFTFNNDASLNKDHSNHVLGRIYLDNNGNLTLAYWPSPKRWEENTLPPMKKEVLMEGVENLAFEFYVAPTRETEEPPKETEGEQKDGKQQSSDKASDKDKEKENLKKGKAPPPPSPEPKGAWRQQPWLSEFQQLPAMVKVIVTMPKEKKPIVFAFPLSNTKSHVVYK